tara:strand:- start:30 stop:1394 length:1365 start_codon:yes stop_codon:yes gene_type:complete
MVIVDESAGTLKRSLAKTQLSPFAQGMLLRLVLTFMMRQGRMSCSNAAGAIASQAIHRSQLTRFLARPRWQKQDFNAPLRQALLNLESQNGRFLFLIDATLISQAGQKTQNTYSTGNRKRRPKKGRRYSPRKIKRKNVHSFTFGLLITPSGIRIPFQRPHYTKKYCEEQGLVHQSTAEMAAAMIRNLPLPEGADVVVLGDTAYEAKVVQAACQERGFLWIFPANPERVYAGPAGERPKLRSRLQEWTELSQQTIKLRASTGPYAEYRRLSRWRVGLKQKPRVYYAYQEKQEVRNVGRVQLVFSTMKPNLKKATPDDVKILLSNARTMSVRELIELYSLRWQIELFFKELKSTLGLAQYRFQNFQAVEGWVNVAITTVLFLEQLRASKLRDRRLCAERKQWWQRQRLHGLTIAYREECAGKELTLISKRLQTPGGIHKLKQLISASIPKEYRTNP